MCVALPPGLTKALLVIRCLPIVLMIGRDEFCQGCRTVGSSMDHFAERGTLCDSSISAINYVLNGAKSP